MNKMMVIKRALCGMAAAVIMIAGACTCSMTAFANDGDGVPYTEESITYTGHVMALDQAADAYDAPSEDANVAKSFAAGDTVFVTGEDGDYTSIYYAGKVLYIKKSDISEEAIAAAAAAIEEQNKALEEEFAQKTEEDIAYVNAFMRQQESQKKALIWKIVIGVLVGLIAIVSVIIGIKNNKKEKKA